MVIVGMGDKDGIQAVHAQPTQDRQDGSLRHFRASVIFAIIVAAAVYHQRPTVGGDDEQAFALPNIHEGEKRSGMPFLPRPPTAPSRQQQQPEQGEVPCP
jgi:hypothetical protein